MTPRERAVKSLARMPACREIGGIYLGDDDADCAIDWVESAGCAVVDAEVYRLLVEAVRARARWEDARAAYGASFAAMSEEQEDLEREFDRCGDLAVDAMERAVKALENSGE